MKDDAESRAWTQEKLQGHVTHLYKCGVLSGEVRVEVAWIVPGRVCISRVVNKGDRRQSYWAISSGEITDHLTRSAAETPRQAARHFAMKWQLESARLDADGKDETGYKPAEERLKHEAEALYAMTEQDANWIS